LTGETEDRFLLNDYVEGNLSKMLSAVPRMIENEKYECSFGLRRLNCRFSRRTKTRFD
jgi:hypothetical protein